MTNRWLGLPIFAVVMFLVYYLSMVTVGTAATDWANDGLFGDGWHLLGIGSSAYSDASDEYTEAMNAVNAFIGTGEAGADELAEALTPKRRALTPPRHQSCWNRMRRSSHPPTRPVLRL